MNRSFRSAIPTGRTIIVLLGIIGSLTLACNGPAKRKAAGEDPILSQAPFVQLTDSIQRSGQADLPGLYFRRAELLSRNDKHELAVEDYKKSWILAPQEITGIRYASTLAILGRSDQALTLLKDCVSKYPADLNFKSMLGEAYVQAGRMPDALQLYTDMLKADSTDFETWYEKALVQEKLKDTSGAIASLNKAYHLQPTNTYTLELAHIYAESGNRQALVLCDEVLRKDPSNQLLDPMFIKGIYYSNTGQYKQAMVQFDSCIGRDWKFTDAYLEKGIALFKQKNYQEAMNTFLMTIKVSNTYPDGYFWTGRCYEALGKKEEALLYYERAYALDKDFIEAQQAAKRLK